MSLIQSKQNLKKRNFLELQDNSPIYYDSGIFANYTNYLPPALR
jgi:hypothetical protein